MAHGVPAVSFDCPTGPSDLISNGGNGFLVAPGDIDTAANRCIELARNPKLRDEMGLRAMKVADQFSFDRIADLWASLLDAA